MNAVVTLGREALIRRLNPHLATLVSFEEVTRMRPIHWQELLTPRRFDVVAKLVYARARLQGRGKDWATEAYREHLRVWSGFVERDGSGKDTFDKFQDAFDTVIDTIASRGFDAAVSVLPIGLSGGLIDGSHRAAACIATQQDAWAVDLAHDGGDYSAEHFRAMGLSEDYLDAMAVEYARVRNDTRVVCLFPVASRRRTAVESLLNEYGAVVYRKPVVFSGYGPQNLIAQLYRDESWLGARAAGWPGSRSHVQARFVPERPVWFYLLQFDKPAHSRQLKERIRVLCGCGNYALHINDTHEETVRLAGQLFNANSIDLMNRGDLSISRTTLALHAKFRAEIDKRGLDAEDFCVDGSSVMALYGLRDGNDFDFLTEIDPPVFNEALINCHNTEVDWYEEPINRLVYDPRLFLRYDGVKYVSLAVLGGMKLRRGEKKDRRDAAAIQQLGVGAAITPFLELSGAADRRTQFIRLVRAVLPARVRRPVNRALHTLRAGAQALRRAPDFLRSNPQIRYRGFEVSYDAGDALVDRIRGGDLYEPEVTRTLLRLLQRSSPAPLLVDIGANIGLVSLNLLSLLPSTRIHAFEPGPRTAELLRRTISNNHLDGAITLHALALSNESGTANFAQHSRRNCSGDGFVDTGRAGRCRSIEVATGTLDQWWEDVGRPGVDVIKIDTEGAELWVLEGGLTLLERCRPAIVLEVNSRNLARYPHGADALETLLNSHGYRLWTLAGTQVPAGELTRFCQVSNDFVALPPGRLL